MEESMNVMQSSNVQGCISVKKWFIVNRTICRIQDVAVVNKDAPFCCEGCFKVLSFCEGGLKFRMSTDGSMIRSLQTRKPDFAMSCHTETKQLSSPREDSDKSGHTTQGPSPITTPQVSQVEPFRGDEDDMESNLGLFEPHNELLLSSCWIPAEPHVDRLYDSHPTIEVDIGYFLYHLSPSPYHPSQPEDYPLPGHAHPSDPHPVFWQSRHREHPYVHDPAGRPYQCLPPPQAPHDQQARHRSIPAHTHSWFLSQCLTSKASSLALQAFLSSPGCTPHGLHTVRALTNTHVQRLAPHAYGSFVVATLLERCVLVRTHVCPWFVALLRHQKPAVNEFVSRCMQILVKRELVFLRVVVEELCREFEGTDSREVGEGTGRQVVSGPVLFLYLSAIKEVYSCRSDKDPSRASLGQELGDQLRCLTHHLTFFLLVRGTEFGTASIINNCRKLNRLVLSFCQWAPIEFLDLPLKTVLFADKDINAIRTIEFCLENFAPIWRSYCSTKREEQLLMKSIKSSTLRKTRFTDMIEEKFGLLCIHLLLERNHPDVWEFFQVSLNQLKLNSEERTSRREMPVDPIGRLKLLWKHVKSCNWCEASTKARLREIFTTFGLYVPSFNRSDVRNKS